MNNVELKIREKDDSITIFINQRLGPQHWVTAKVLRIKHSISGKVDVLVYSGKNGEQKEAKVEK